MCSSDLKALRGLEVGATGFDEMVDLEAPDALTKIRHELKEAPLYLRRFAI